MDFNDTDYLYDDIDCNVGELCLAFQYEDDFNDSNYLYSDFEEDIDCHVEEEDCFDYLYSDDIDCNVEELCLATQNEDDIDDFKDTNYFNDSNYLYSDVEDDIDYHVEEEVDYQLENSFHETEKVEVDFNAEELCLATQNSLDYDEVNYFHDTENAIIESKKKIYDRKRILEVENSNELLFSRRYYELVEVIIDRILVCDLSSFKSVVSFVSTNNCIHRAFIDKLNEVNRSMLQIRKLPSKFYSSFLPGAIAVARIDQSFSSMKRDTIIYFLHGSKFCHQFESKGIVLDGIRSDEEVKKFLLSEKEKIDLALMC
jgi:hypothetical protein